MLLEVARPRACFYGRIQALKGISFDGRGGRDRHPDRRQRRRQDHDAEDHLRRAPGAAGSVQVRRPGHHHGGRRTSGSQLGICQAPEGRGIFPGMTVLENLEMGATPARTASSAAKARRTSSGSHAVPRLKERHQQSGGTLSGGEQQMLAIGRALMARPRLLLLDEPSMGLAPMLIAQIFAIIREINAAGHDRAAGRAERPQALRLADRAYVLETGPHREGGHGRRAAARPVGDRGLPRRRRRVNRREPCGPLADRSLPSRSPVAQLSSDGYGRAAWAISLGCGRSWRRWSGWSSPSPAAPTPPSCAWVANDTLGSGPGGRRDRAVALAARRRPRPLRRARRPSGASPGTGRDRRDRASRLRHNDATAATTARPSCWRSLARGRRRAAEVLLGT